MPRLLTQVFSNLSLEYIPNGLGPQNFRHQSSGLKQKQLEKPTLTCLGNTACSLRFRHELQINAALRTPIRYSIIIVPCRFHPAPHSQRGPLAGPPIRRRRRAHNARAGGDAGADRPCRGGTGGAAPSGQHGAGGPCRTAWLLSFSNVSRCMKA